MASRGSLQVTDTGDVGSTRPASPSQRLRGMAQEFTQHVDGALGGLLHKGEHAALLKKKVNQKDDFHMKRKRCITNPDRALETLGPYAKLELIVQAGRNLMPRSSWTGASYVDSCVGLFLDDVELKKKRSYVVRATTTPLWQHTVDVDIVSPFSMLRFQVFDDQITKQEEHGFVEICVGDIPYDTPIAGWFELRFQENLKNTSVQRYASHCAMREDDLGISHADAGTLVSEFSKSLSKSNVSSVITAKDLKARREISERALHKTRTMMHSCATSCMGTGPSTAKAEHDRGNAGELFIQLRLTKVVPSSTALFALALEQPVPMNHGDYLLQEDQESGQVRRSLDLQKCYDVVADVRMRLWEDFIACIYYYCWYIASWRAPLLSAPLYIVALACGVHLYYWSIMWPGVAALLLFVNSWEDLRKNMTRGGLNALVTDDGFRRVALWKKSSEMYFFLKRIVEIDMQGTIVDQKKLQLMASRVARDGVPLVSLTELREMLREATDMVSFPLELPGNDTFHKGDLVMLDERHMGKVEHVNGQDVSVILDVHDNKSPVKEQSKAKPDGGTGASSNSREPAPPPVIGMKKVITVDRSRIRKRHTVHFYQTWLLPSSIQNTIMDIMDQASSIENSSLYPVVELLTDIVCWKRRKAISFAITTALAGLCALFLHMEYEYEDELSERSEGHNSDGANELEESIAWFVVSFLRNVDNLIYFAVVFLIFIFPARWFVGFRSVCKIVGRASMRRTAPSLWKFYTPDDAMRQQVENLAPAASEWERLKTFVGQAKPDFQKLQQRAASLKGMANYKLPDLSHPSNAKNDGHVSDED